MSGIQETLKVALKRLRGRPMSYKTLLLLAFAFPSETVEWMSTVTVGEVLFRLEGRRGLASKALSKLLEGRGADELVFRSRKARGIRPANRTTLWRVLKEAVGGGVQVLRRLVAGIGTLTYPESAMDLPERMTIREFMAWTDRRTRLTKVE